MQRWVIIILLMASCGPAAKLRRAERLIKKAEQMGSVWHVDTVTTIQYVPVKSVRIDTAFKNTRDTVVIEKERLRMRYYTKHDTVHLQGECLPDTIKIEVPVTVTKTIESRSGPPWWVWLIVCGVFVLGVWAGTKASRRA